MRIVMRLFALAIGLVLTLPADLRAYADRPTHSKLTDGTFRLLPQDSRELHAYRCDIAHGSVVEDEEPRYLYHFWDPVTGRGLPRNSYTLIFSAVMGIATTGRPGGPGLEPSPSYRTAMDWAWDEMPDDFDWLGAIDAYGKGDLQKAYKGLGHVLHLLQDLGQPDHSTSRPHPGNYVAQYVPGFTTVGYEGLWGQPNIFWPPGTDIERRPSLQGFFRAMADLARDEERPVRAAWKDEVALGLGTIKHERMGRAIVVVGEAAGFVDNNWKKFELEAAVWPLIPLQQSDPRFRDHFELGKRLLPRIEQFGTGLLLHFHEIVNPPPYIEGVEISQNDVPKYLKGWTDRGESRGFGALSDQPLERNVPAKVTIRVGPRHPLPKVGVPAVETAASICSSYDPNLEVRDRLATMTVTIRTQSGSKVLAVTEGGESRTPDGGVWTGTFVPTESGTLEIEASDLDAHFAQRQPLGDVLDSDPATRARATTGERYAWAGYEPGPDKRHSFRVIGGSPCQQLDQDKLRFGTWSGTTSTEVHRKGFDLLLAGKVWYETSERTNASVRFRSRFKNCEDENRVLFGPGSGNFTRHKSMSALERRLEIRTGPTRDVTYKDVPKETKESFEGPVKVDSGGVFFSDGSASISLRGRSRESGESFGFSAEAQGKDCELLAIEGGESGESGAPSAEFWRKYQTSWSFRFEGEAQPAHAAICPACFDATGTDTAVSTYLSRAMTLLEPAINSLMNAQRYDEATRVSGVLNEMAELATSFDGSVEVEVWTLCEQASELWLLEDPGYNGIVGQARAKMQQVEAEKRRIANEVIQVTNRAATSIERITPQAAAALRQLAQTLASKGWAAFGG